VLDTEHLSSCNMVRPSRGIEKKLVEYVAMLIIVSMYRTHFL